MASENSASAAPAPGVGTKGCGLLAGLGAVERRLDERVVVALEIGRVDADGLVGAAAALEEVAIALHDAQRGPGLFVGLLVEDLGANGIAEEIADQRGVEILEVDEGLVAVQAVQRLEREVELAFAGMGPAHQQAGGQFAHRRVGGDFQVLARLGIAAVAEVAQAQNDARHALLAVEAEDLNGIFLGIRDVAFRRLEQEHPLDEDRIARIGLEGADEVIRGQVIVARHAGRAPGQVVARQQPVVELLVGRGGLGGEGGGGKGRHHEGAKRGSQH